MSRSVNIIIHFSLASSGSALQISERVFQNSSSHSLPRDEWRCLMTNATFQVFNTLVDVSQTMRISRLIEEYENESGFLKKIRSIGITVSANSNLRWATSADRIGFCTETCPGCSLNMIPKLISEISFFCNARLTSRRSWIFLKVHFCLRYHGVRIVWSWKLRIISKKD